MKTSKFVTLVLALALLTTPSFFVSAKTGDAPGIQNKVPLEISNVIVSTTLTTATISWTTSKPSSGSVLIWNIPIEFGQDVVGYADDHNGTRHSVTIQVIAGLTYGYSVGSYSDLVGSATPVNGSFTVSF